jgi:hypothetical protein
MFDGKLYYVLTVLCWMYALVRGGLPEKIGASILTVGSVLSVAAISGWPVRYGSLELGVFLVDLATLAGFLVLALRAERYWPLWLTALQIIGIAAHAVKLLDPGVIGRAYAFAMQFWGYPMWLMIALGTYRHQQRLVRNGVDPSWSTFSARSARVPPRGPTD